MLFLCTSTDEEVTGGQIEIDLKWGIFPINQKVDLCDALKQAGRSCPLQAGTQTISVVQTIPGDAPSVSQQFYVFGYTIPLVCHGDVYIHLFRATYPNTDLATS